MSSTKGHLKRGVVREACDFCHKRKIKCMRSDGADSPCAQCLARRISCRFSDDDDLRRGSRVGSHFAGRGLQVSTEAPPSEMPAGGSPLSESTLVQMGPITTPDSVQHTPASRSTSESTDSYNQLSSGGSSDGERPFYEDDHQPARPTGRCTELSRRSLEASSDLHASIWTRQQGNRRISSITDPKEFLGPQIFLHNVVRYINGAFENGIFVYNESGEAINRSSPASWKTVNNFRMCCLTAIGLYEQGNLQDAFQGPQGFHVASIYCEKLLDERNPRLFEVVADISLQMLHKGMEGVVLSLLRQLCGLAKMKAKRLGEEGQPWGRIFSSLEDIAEYSPGQLVEILETAWKCGYDTFAALPSAEFYPTNLICYSTYHLRRYQDGGIPRSLLEGIAQMLPDEDGTNPMTLHQQYAKGMIHYTIGQYGAALHCMNRVIARCNREDEQDNSVQWRRLRIDAFETSARCHKALDSQAPASGHSFYAGLALGNAIQCSRQEYGEDAPMTLGFQSLIETWASGL